MAKSLRFAPLVRVSTETQERQEKAYVHRRLKLSGR